MLSTFENYPRISVSIYINFYINLQFEIYINLRSVYTN